MSDSVPSLRERILDAAFGAFMRLGYSGTSTAQIARLARVSKRDLYALFGSKQAMLADCVAERAARMRRALELPVPSDQEGLRRTLRDFGMTVLRELSSPEVLATFRLAILEAENAPDVARTLDQRGRAANLDALTGLLREANARGLLAGEPTEMAWLFLAVLVGGGLLVRQLMRVAPAPTEAEARARAERAVDTLSRLYPPATKRG